MLAWCHTAGIIRPADRDAESPVGPGGRDAKSSANRAGWDAKACTSLLDAAIREEFAPAMHLQVVGLFLTDGVRAFRHRIASNGCRNERSDRQGDLPAPSLTLFFSPPLFPSDTTTVRARAQGMLFASGRKGIGRNHTAALHLFERGARLGNPQCAHNAGVLLSKGIGVPQNTTAAEMWLTIGAEAGSADSQFVLGGVHCGDEVGVKWLRKASLQGHDEAANMLAIRYLKGIGTDKKPEAAIKWFRQAASMGNVGSMHNLARALSSGTKHPPGYIHCLLCVLDWQPRLAACTSWRGRCR
jgi:hypothetical protein